MGGGGGQFVQSTQNDQADGRPHTANEFIGFTSVSLNLMRILHLTIYTPHSSHIQTYFYCCCPRSLTFASPPVCVRIIFHLPDALGRAFPLRSTLLVHLPVERLSCERTTPLDCTAQSNKLELVFLVPFQYIPSVLLRITNPTKCSQPMHLMHLNVDACVRSSSLCGRYEHIHRHTHFRMYARCCRRRSLSRVAQGMPYTIYPPPPTATTARSAYVYKRSLKVINSRRMCASCAECTYSFSLSHIALE